MVLKCLTTFLFSFALLTGFSSQFHLEADPNCLDSLVIPNAFSPNADGNSDVFAIHFPCPPEKFSINIYNRWGELIYASEDPSFGWNGLSTEGQEVPVGAYVYKLQYTYHGKEEEINGNVVLLR